MIRTQTCYIPNTYCWPHFIFVFIYIYIYYNRTIKCREVFLEDYKDKTKIKKCFYFQLICRPLEAHEALPVRQHRVVLESQAVDGEENEVRSET